MSDKLTIDDLGGMIKNGFDQVDKRFEDIEEKNKKHFNTLEQGQEDIKLRLTNVAYRFELQELESRVKNLEQKLLNQ